MQTGTDNGCFSGQVAIVTGAARAIGRQISETLASRGAVVEIFDVAAAEETVDAIRAGGGRRNTRCWTSRMKPE